MRETGRVPCVYAPDPGEHREAGVSAARVPPPIDPFQVATVARVVRPADGYGPERPAILCEVRGYPEAGGAYYWTPAQARAIAQALNRAGASRPDFGQED